jgi:hypothetical protein
VNIDDELPPLTGLHTVAEERKEAEAIPAEHVDLKKIAGDNDPDADNGSSQLILNIILAFLILFALVAITSVSMKKKK